MIDFVRRRPLVRAAAGGVLALALAGSLIAAKFDRAGDWSGRVQAMALQGGSPHGAIFILLQVGVAAFGFLPASLMAIAAGVAYGLWVGFLLSASGTLIGGTLAFLLSRSALRPWITKWIARHPRLARLDSAVAADGWRFVCLLRLSPIMPFAATSYGLGLTRLDLKSFLIGTLASLPALLGYVAIGAVGQAGLSLHSGEGGLLHLLLLVVGAIGTIWLVAHARRLMRAGLVRAGPAE